MKIECLLLLKRLYFPFNATKRFVSYARFQMSSIFVGTSFLSFYENRSSRNTLHLRGENRCVTTQSMTPRKTGTRRNWRAGLGFVTNLSISTWAFVCWSTDIRSNKLNSPILVSLLASPAGEQKWTDFVCGQEILNKVSQDFWSDIYRIAKCTLLPYTRNTRLRSMSTFRCHATFLVTQGSLL